MDFENYLLSELYRIANELDITNKIHVAEYRSFQMPEDKTDLLFVVRYITGSYVGDVKTQPMQIFAYSELNNIQSVFLILDTFAKEHSNFQTTIDNTFIKMNYETPVSMRNFIQSETGYRASVYCFGSYVECAGITDIKRIEYGVETTLPGPGGSQTVTVYHNINYLSISRAYAAVLNTTKITGEQLSQSIKQEAGITLSMNLMHTNSLFCRKIDAIMEGTENGNFDFNLRFTKTDDSVKVFTYKLETATLPSDKTSAPMLQLTFRR